MEYSRDSWDRNDGRQIPCYDSEPDSLDSKEPFILEPYPSSYETNHSPSQHVYHHQQARIEEIDSRDNSQSDSFSEEDESYQPRTFSPPPQIQAQYHPRQLVPFGEHQYLDETPVISPARYHQWTSPGETQFPTSQLSYDPGSRSGSYSRSPESGSLIDHPSADVDQYFDFDAASAHPTQTHPHEPGQVSKRRIEEISDDSEDEDQGREVRVEKRKRIRSPQAPHQPPAFQQPHPVPREEPEHHQDKNDLPQDDDLEKTEPVIQQSRGRKRSLEESGHDSVETVLKRPFRTPAPRVVLAKATPKVVSSPHSTPTRPLPAPPKTSGPKSLVFRSVPTRLPLAPAPSSQQSSPVPPASDPQEFFDSLRAKSGLPKLGTRPINTTNNGRKTMKPKAFKPPLIKPAGTEAGPGHDSRSKGAGSVMAIITNLEKEARILRQAVRYLSNPDEDDRLVDLISQWRSAGREVVEQLYDRVPKPDPSTDADNDNNNASSTSTSWFTGAGGESSMNDYQFTEEQERYLKYCAKNQDGEPVDEEGNSLIPHPGDLGRIVEEESRGRRGESGDYIPTYQNVISGTRIKKVETEEEPKEWNMGNMMLRFSVDPALLGWDDDLEDWADIDDTT